MDTVVNTSGTTDYDYNHRNQLASVTRTDSSVVDYTYDHTGNRTSRTIGSSVTKYVWDEYSAYGDVILEADETDTTIAEYTLANGQLVSQNRSGTPSYYLYDAQGSVRSLTNSSGTPTDQYDYTAFGELKNYSGSSTPNNYQYTGQQYDDEIDLYSLRARYYDPANGRFLSKDTWPIDLQNPVELNRYGYTANNPVNYFDPSGLSAFKEFGSLVSKVGTLAIQGIRYLVEGEVPGTAGTPSIFWQAFGTLVAGAFQGMVGYITGILLAKKDYMDKDFNSREFAEAAIMGAVINGANMLTDRAITHENSGRFHKHLVPMVVGFGLIVVVAKLVAAALTYVLSNFVYLDPDERANTEDATDENLVYEVLTNMVFGFIRYKQGLGKGHLPSRDHWFSKLEPYFTLAASTWGVWKY